MGKLSSIVDSHFVSYSVFGKFFRIPQVICDDFVLFFSLYLPFMLSLFGFQGAFFRFCQGPISRPSQRADFNVQCRLQGRLRFLLPWALKSILCRLLSSFSLPPPERNDILTWSVFHVNRHLMGFRKVRGIVVGSMVASVSTSLTEPSNLRRILCLVVFEIRAHN